MSDSTSESARPVIDTTEFFFDGGGLSALLIHGLTGTPYEMRYLGERLRDTGARVLGVRLAGHAGTPEELAATTYRDWYASALTALERLRRHGNPIVVIGQSMGAVLAARLAIERADQVAAIALLAPAFYLPFWIDRALGAFALLGPLNKRIYLRGDGSDIHDETARRIHPSAHRMALSAAINLHRLSGIVRPRLGRLRQPALIIHARQDHTCPFERNVDFLVEKLGSDEKRLVALDESYHVISVDGEKTRVAAEVIAFSAAFRTNREPGRAAQA